MFDFSAGEIVIIGTVALLVLGPEQLPKVARTVGRWTAKGQRYVQEFKGQMQQELDTTHLNQVKEEVTGAFNHLHQDLHSSFHGNHTDNNSSSQDAVDFDQLAHQESQHTHDAHSWYTPHYVRPRKRLRNKRTSTPLWYKQVSHTKQRVQSGAARMKRFKVDSSKYF